MPTTILGLPINRFVTFVKPWINVGAGIAAAFLVAKANVLGFPGLDQENVQTYIAGGGALLLTTGLAALGDLKWIKGHHLEIENEGLVLHETTVPDADETENPPVGAVPPDLR